MSSENESSQNSFKNIDYFAHLCCWLVDWQRNVMSVVDRGCCETLATHVSRISDTETSPSDSGSSLKMSYSAWRRLTDHWKKHASSPHWFWHKRCLVRFQWMPRNTVLDRLELDWNWGNIWRRACNKMTSDAGKREEAQGKKGRKRKQAAKLSEDRTSCRAAAAFWHAA